MSRSKSGLERVSAALEELGIRDRVQVLEGSSRSAPEAAQAVGCDVAQIVKSLVFMTRDRGEPLLVMASGANRVNEERVAGLLGEPIDKPGADYVRTVTGFAIGGVSPVAHAQPLQAFIDADLMQFETIWAAAGAPNAVFRLTPVELQSITGARVINCH